MGLLLLARDAGGAMLPMFLRRRSNGHTRRVRQKPAILERSTSFLLAPKKKAQRGAS
jgi:hypothetical protein